MRRIFDKHIYFKRNESRQPTAGWIWHFQSLWNARYVRCVIRMHARIACKFMRVMHVNGYIVNRGWRAQIGCVVVLGPEAFAHFEQL